MIVCSCNVFSDTDVRTALANAPGRPCMSGVYASLGCAARCGRCAKTIKALMDDAAGSADRGETCCHRLRRAA
jgi:bacterioferritin-associated ferredoxin